MHFKICGITTIEDADLALEAGASAIGLNLVPASLRAIDTETAGRITVHVGARALVVLVVADESLERMQELVRVTGARCLQLHGDETPELVERVLPHAYKAIRVASLADVERAVGYPGEHLLVDAKVEGKLGGTGKTLDWSLVEPLARARKLTLAGGLRAENVGEAIARVRPFCVDVASGVERDDDPRRKDPNKLVAFARAVARATTSPR
ncbi:MAG TPA: phosphoribosylanthranilate isomerase [Polyangiaceae bacterium]